MYRNALARGVRLVGCRAPDVDLPGDGGGDECRAALLEEVDGELGFGGESPELICQFGPHEAVNEATSIESQSGLPPATGRRAVVFPAQR